MNMHYLNKKKNSKAYSFPFIVAQSNKTKKYSHSQLQLQKMLDKNMLNFFLYFKYNSKSILQLLGPWALRCVYLRVGCHKKSHQ